VRGQIPKGCHASLVTLHRDIVNDLTNFPDQSKRRGDDSGLRLHR
jgi:hypothetical protein